MADQVIYSNLFSESRNNVVALITTTNVPDPVSVSSEFRKWIYSREPDAKSTDFGGYPYIIVHPSNVDFGGLEEGGKSLDMKSEMVLWDIDNGLGKTKKPQTGAVETSQLAASHIASIEKKINGTGSATEVKKNFHGENLLFYSIYSTHPTGRTYSGL